MMMPRMPPLVTFVLVIVLLTGSEYVFMLLRTPFPLDSLRGFSAIFDTVHHRQAEHKLNGTIHDLAVAVRKETVHKQQLATLVERIQDLETKMQDPAHQNANHDDIASLQEELSSVKIRKPISQKDLNALGKRLAVFEEKLTAKGVQTEELVERLSEFENKIQSQQSVTKEDLKSLTELLSTVDEKIHVLANQRSLDVTLVEDSYGSNNETFCVPWSTNMDAWWTHHPDWEVVEDNATHQCFRPMEDREKAHFFRDLYQVQFRTDCSNITVKRTWNSGWGADFRNVVDGLQHAVSSRMPTVIYTPQYWKYAATANQSVCPAADISCYFLNISRCEANPKQPRYKHLMNTKQHKFYKTPGSWYLEYSTRQLTWLRKAVHDFSSKVNITSPCTVMHVRRADVVLHRNRVRKYHEIEEYVKALKHDDTTTKNIFLLTDDHNAIGEALSRFPHYNWMYIDRPRHKGPEGGFENQIPSQDPKFEVIVLLSIFRLVKRCSTLVHTKSGFADLLRREMEDETLSRINIEAGSNLFDPEHAKTVNESQSYPQSNTTTTLS